MIGNPIGYPIAGIVSPVSSVVYTYAGSGGITLGGTASSAVNPAYLPTGGITISGTAPVSFTKVYAASGGISIGGAAVTQLIPNTDFDYTISRPTLALITTSRAATPFAMTTAHGVTTQTEIVRS